MSHFTVREWGHVKIGEGGFTRGQADALFAAACQHPLAGRDATNILVYRQDRIVARQMVGMLSAKGCSLEILPKVDPEKEDGLGPDAVRGQLVQMLDVALGLDLDMGRKAAMDRQKITLLDILIRAFADKLLAEVRRGLPRLYRHCEDDLPALRGRLDTTRQLTRNLVRPDRLACRFDQLDPDTPLMQVMASAVAFLTKHSRSVATRRKLDELRHAFVDIRPVAPNRLPWKEVQIDRTNRRWESLFGLAQLLLRREWQATHHAEAAPEGVSLLFPMNDLFEKYVAALMRKGLAGSGIKVVDQGGHKACLGQYTRDKILQRGNVFQTRPDLILRRSGETLAIIDTKWKKLSVDPLSKKQGVSQADVYQLMAYARLYPTTNLMLLYPEIPNAPCGERSAFGIVGGKERLSIATIDPSLSRQEFVERIEKLINALLNADPDAQAVPSSKSQTALL